MGSEEEEVKVEVLRTCMVVPLAGETGREPTRHLFLPGSDSYWRWVPYNGRLLFYANDDNSNNTAENNNIGDADDKSENDDTTTINSSGDDKSDNYDSNNINSSGDDINDNNSNNVDGDDNSNNNAKIDNKNDGSGDDDDKANKGHQGALNYPLLVASLKSSLARTLVDYYPFAGRLSPSHKDEGRLEILCEGQGVLFVEAFAHTSFKELQRDGFQIKGFFQDLAPTPPATGDDDVAFNSPLLCVQVTRFREGEIALGCVHSHVLGDGASFWNFMVSWAKYAKRVHLVSPIIPVHDRTLLDFRKGFIQDTKDEEKDASYLDISWKNPFINGHSEEYVPKEPLVTKVFHFNDGMIMELKRLANTLQKNSCMNNTCINVTMNSPHESIHGAPCKYGRCTNFGKDTCGECSLRQRNTHVMGCGSDFESSVVVKDKDDHIVYKEKGFKDEIAQEKSVCKGYYTRFEALCAHLWKRIVASRCLEETTKVGLVIMADVRSRVEPNIPKEYVGNAILARTVIATASEILGEPIYETVTRIRGTIDNITNLSIKHEMACLEGVTLRQLARWGHGFVCLNVVSSPRFPIYDVDFGWHPPTCARPISVGMRGNNVMFAHNRGALVLFPAKDGGIDVCITLQCRPMQNLINDPFLLPNSL